MTKPEPEDPMGQRKRIADACERIADAIERIAIAPPGSLAVLADRIDRVTAALNTAISENQPGHVAPKLKGRKVMAGELDRLTASVTALEEVDASVLQLISNIAQALRDAIAANDPAALTALADRLDTQKQALLEAVNANTPGF